MIEKVYSSGPDRVIVRIATYNPSVDTGHFIGSIDGAACPLHQASAKPLDDIIRELTDKLAEYGVDASNLSQTA